MDFLTKTYVALGGVVILAAQTAVALPMYAAREKRPCAFCHVNPAGGGPRNPIGQIYAANGHRFPKPGGQPSGAATPVPSHQSLWDRMDFSATVVVAHTLTSGQHSSGGDCYSCHDAEYIPNNQILLMSGRAEVAVRATDRLTIFLSNDLGTMREAYALYSAAYNLVNVKAGLFVVPFGMKMRDHTSFVRGKFNVGSNRRDIGLAVQGTPGPFFYEASLTRGGDLIPLLPPVQSFGGDKKTFSAVGGLRWQGAEFGASFLSGRSSFVDRFDTPDSVFHPSQNANRYNQLRYGVFGMYSIRMVTVQGEVVYGTDKETRSDTTGLGPRQSFPRLGAYFGVLVTPVRWLDLGARYEFFDPSRDHAGDALTHYVLSAEANIAPGVAIQGRYRIRQESSQSFQNNDFMTILRISL